MYMLYLQKCWDDFTSMHAFHALTLHVARELFATFPYVYAVFAKLQRLLRDQNFARAGFRLVAAKPCLSVPALLCMPRCAL